MKDSQYSYFTHLSFQEICSGRLTKQLVFIIRESVVDGELNLALLTICFLRGARDSSWFCAKERAMHNESALNIMLQNSCSTRGFQKSPAPLRSRLPTLRYSCGSLATVFSSTSSVESDVSVLNWEFDEFCQSLTEFSLEGILQSKQFPRLHELQI